MSRKSNVNPDHYKQAGRGRQGEDVAHEVERQKFKEVEKSASRRPKKGAKKSRPRKKAVKK